MFGTLYQPTLIGVVPGQACCPDHSSQLCGQVKTMTQDSNDSIAITLFKTFPTLVYDLSQGSVTEIEAVFPTISGTPLVKKLSLSQISKVNTGLQGQILIPFLPADLDLMIGSDPCDIQRQSFILWITDGGLRQAIRFDNALVILTNPFPGV